MKEGLQNSSFFIMFIKIKDYATKYATIRLLESE